MERIDFHTTEREELLDITRLVLGIVKNKDWRKGALVVYSPHTSGAVTINEAADPCVVTDMVGFMHRLIPQEDSQFCHSEGNSDAHIKASLIGQSVTVIIEDRALQLGNWQGIYFYEGDGPRRRSVWLQFLPG